MTAAAVPTRARAGRRSPTRPTSTVPTADRTPNPSSSPLSPPGVREAVPARSGATNVYAAKCPTSSSPPRAAVTSTGRSAEASDRAAGDGSGPGPTAPGAGRTSVSTAAAAGSDTTATPTKPVRQPHTSAAALAAGTPSTVPRVAPPRTTATERARRSGGTMAALCALTVAHSSPHAAAPTSRDPRATPNDPAAAVTALDAPSTSTAAAITRRPSTRRVSRTSGKLATTTMSAHADTSMPVRDAGTPRSALMAGSTAVGSISAATTVKVTAPRVSRLGHGRAAGSPDATDATGSPDTTAPVRGCAVLMPRP
ncbi:hypothetical protein CHMI_01288 [Cellulomonas hominis]|nr:hypothetical protein CHMI_01288 [Cellulomonas hominis]